MPANPADSRDRRVAPLLAARRSAGARAPRPEPPSPVAPARPRLRHMPEGLWWLPSLLVFGAAAVAIVGRRRSGFRRLGARRERAALDDGRALEVRAKGLIVQADTAVREAEREVAFADAQFGAATARDVRDALETARARLREAFLLQQRLDDADADTAAERRTWSSRIVDLCDSALRAIGEADAALAARRRAERGAGADLPALREDAARLAAPARGRLGDARAARHAVRAARRSAPRTRQPLGSMRRSADATAALDDAERRLARSEPAAELLAVVADRLDRAVARPRRHRGRRARARRGAVGCRGGGRVARRRARRRPRGARRAGRCRRRRRRSARRSAPPRP